MIYFVRRADGTGPIKIGMTDRLTARLKQLSKEWEAELQVLGVIPGGRPEEKALHERFADLRVDGEWFAPEPVLCGFIDDEADFWDGKDEKTDRDIRLRVDTQLRKRIQDAASRDGNPVAAFIREAVVRELNRLDREGVRRR